MAHRPHSRRGNASFRIRHRRTVQNPFHILVGRSLGTLSPHTNRSLSHFIKITHRRTWHAFRPARHVWKSQHIDDSIHIIVMSAGR